MKVEDPESLILSMTQIIEQEYETIKELTDFEEGLGFAIHRLLELKQIQFNYLKNPFYEIGISLPFALESIEDIDKQINVHIDQLLKLEQSEINTKLFY